MSGWDCSAFKGTNSVCFLGVQSVKKHLQDKLERSRGHPCCRLRPAGVRAHGCHPLGQHHSELSLQPPSIHGSCQTHPLHPSRGNKADSFHPHTPARLTPAHRPLGGSAPTSAPREGTGALQDPPHPHPHRALAPLASPKRLNSAAEGCSNLPIDNLQMFCSPNLFHYSQKHAVTLATATLYFISKLQSFLFPKNKPHKSTHMACNL